MVLNKNSQTDSQAGTLCLLASCRDISVSDLGFSSVCLEKAVPPGLFKVIHAVQVAIHGLCVEGRVISVSDLGFSSVCLEKAVPPAFSR